MSLSRGSSSLRAKIEATGISLASGTWPALYSGDSRTSMTATSSRLIISLPSSTLMRAKGSCGSLSGIRIDLPRRWDCRDCNTNYYTIPPGGHNCNIRRRLLTGAAPRGSFVGEEGEWGGRARGGGRPQGGRHGGGAGSHPAGARQPPLRVRSHRRDAAAAGEDAG